ncbi:MAG: double-strand break repair protein AddB [Alphaproteobacteria bacterium]|nr:double-strand break repair protein AddB [Alphaproteobacteria bacterium]
MGAVFTIDTGTPFLDALAAGLAARAGTDPLALARMTVLLPTRRAARSLAEAFLRQGDGRPLLLPRLVPVGDVDAEELAILADEAAGDGMLDLPPAVPELKRRLMLAQLVLAWGKARGAGPANAAQAAPLAAELARFLDEVASEGCTLANLDRLVPAQHAAHWQQVVRFLAIVSEHWPNALAEIGCLDAADRRNRVLERQAAAWRQNPPAHPVIAAGITGGVPAVAELVAAVARLPNGMVVLPGLDRAADAAEWEAIAADPAHPQHLLARLLARLELTPGKVATWPAVAPGGGNPARSALLRAVLAPAARSHRWTALRGLSAAAIDGLARVDCPGPQEEATTIALLMRRQLEHPGRTAALVTPDRDLARRVAGELRRWNIDVDDSAGTPLAQAPPGVFLRLLLACVAEELAPLPLLALLKHPLAAGGLTAAQFRELTRRLEIAALRGPRPGAGVEGLRVAVGDRDLADHVGRVGRALAPLVAALAAETVELEHLVQAHIGAAEALAATADDSGDRCLWREEAGEAAAVWLNELLAAARGFPKIAGAEYPALFEALIAAPVVRPAYGRHPRLFIWGLLEARLQQADLVILGGLNEGVWPARTDSDPWLSRPMRREFGLPPPELRIGRAAHDFAQCLGARAVVLTRAARVEGNPTVPSRWLLRLETALRAAGLDARMQGDFAPDGAPRAWQMRLDDPGPVKRTAPPEPRPPLEARPRQLSVTEIETWLRDPYAIYAKHVLRLKAFDPIDADPGAADRGIFIHAALDRFLRAFPHDLPDDAEERLVAFGRECFGEALRHPNVRAFWWPRFERIAAWMVETERERRTRIAQSFGEITGTMTLPSARGPFTLSGKADRIDRLAAGGLAILDYKTGVLPQRGEVLSGYAPQLALEAAIAATGGFPGIPPAAVAALLHWRLTGREPPGEERTEAEGTAAVAALAEAARRGLEKLVAAFDDPAMPYRAWPRPDKAPRYSDYTHLARVAEWLPGGGGE